VKLRAASVKANVPSSLSVVRNLFADDFRNPWLTKPRRTRPPTSSARSGDAHAINAVRARDRPTGHVFVIIASLNP
jgi:hypothetical protein